MGLDWDTMKSLHRVVLALLNRPGASCYARSTLLFNSEAIKACLSGSANHDNICKLIFVVKHCYKLRSAMSCDEINLDNPDNVVA